MHNFKHFEKNGIALSDCMTKPKEMLSTVHNLKKHYKVCGEISSKLMLSQVISYNYDIGFVASNVQSLEPPFEAVLTSTHNLCFKK